MFNFSAMCWKRNVEKKYIIRIQLDNLGPFLLNTSGLPCLIMYSGRIHGGLYQQQEHSESLIPT